MRALNTILALTLDRVRRPITVTLSAQPDAGVAALREDLQARRARLMEKLGSGSMAILWSAPARVYSRDVDYEYRQDSDLLYLTGIEQPETILVLVPGSPRRSEVLFITPSNPRQEHYVGKFLTKEEAQARTGIETVFSHDRVRRVPGGDVQPPAVWPARGRGARQHRLRRLLQGAGRGHREAGAEARRHPGDESAAQRRVRVRESRPRTARSAPASSTSRPTCTGCGR